MKKIKLTKGYEAMVDDHDFEELSKYEWQALVSPYTVYGIRGDRSSGQRKTVYMHRQIMSPKKGLCVDHIDGNGLDNRRKNLRCATVSENQRNQKVHREGRLPGVVSYRKKDGTMSYLPQANTVGKNPGAYATPEEAHQVWLKAKPKKIKEKYLKRRKEALSKTLNLE